MPLGDWKRRFSSFQNERRLATTLCDDYKANRNRRMDRQEDRTDGIIFQIVITNVLNTQDVAAKMYEGGGGGVWMFVIRQ